MAKDSGLTLMKKLSEETTLLQFEKLTCEKQLQVGWIRLCVTILSKLCQVEYKPIVVRLFHKICRRQFIDQLLLHISKLPYETNNNNKKDAGDFFNELSILCSAILELTPNVAHELDIVLKRASQELKDMPHFEGYEGIEKKLIRIREKLQHEKQKFESMIASAPNPVANFAMKPPTDFRDLTHFPAVEDIVVDSYERPFLRPNKVNLKVHGPYEDVDDYLDVHYRLMREDFFRPLREGILEYRKSLRERRKTNSKRAIRIQNIRVYEKVRLLHVETDIDGIGVVLDFDPDNKFASSRIEWEQSKRFMNGSLLVLSADEEFSSIVLVMVSKREPKALLKGRVLVELCEGAVSRDLLRRQYLMVECQVFFGAYLHVLKALKSFKDNSFPLADYIVHASKRQELPDYQVRALNAQKKFKLPIKPKSVSVNDKARPQKDVIMPVDVENLKTWPTSKKLGLDESQYRALTGALTNKLMLIQGPPGTGKTFIGMKIASYLLENRKLWSLADDPRPMLVVCYTNHALDQFLTGLLSATGSMVRLGGGCKEPKLEKKCIRNLRSDWHGREQAQLRQIVDKERVKFNILKSLADPIRHCSSRLKMGLVSLKTFWSCGLVSDQYLQHLTDVDMFMWLCGFNENVRLPKDLRSCLRTSVYLGRDHNAFDLLKFPRAGIPEVSMVSFSFDLLKEKLSVEQRINGIFPDLDLLSTFMDFQQKLAASRYNRRPEQHHQPHPCGIWRLKNDERWQLYR